MTSLITPQQALQLMREEPIMVAGAGVAGKAVITMLCTLRKESSASDIKIVDDHVEIATHTVAEAVESLRHDPPRLIITSPGWAPNSILFDAARTASVPIIGDIEAAWLADQAGGFGMPRQWLAITGTNGKTTTTAMLASMLVSDGRGAVAVGNIGVPPGVALTAEERDQPRADIMVVEASSFQLHWSPSFTPTAGCVLNLAEDHLDWHGSFAAYAQDKAAVLRAEHPVIAVEDPVVAALPRADRPLTGFTTGDPFSIVDPAYQRRVGVRDDAFGLRLVEVIQNPATGEAQLTDLASAEGISPRGSAGVADAAAAAAMARCVGVSAAAIAEALAKFTVQAHRGQVVLSHNGVKWIDNSKATNPHAAQAALRGEHSVIWVAGGQLKGARVEELVTAVKDSLKAVITLGVDQEQIIAEVTRQSPTLPCIPVTTTDPREAMEEVVRVAQQLASPGDTVLLAPAAASLDMFTGMSQRGDLFAEMATNATTGTVPPETVHPDTPTQKD